MNPYGPPGAPAPYPQVQPAYGAPPPGSVSEGALELLRQTRPWVMFIGVMCFIGSGFMLIVAAFMAFAGAAAGMAAAPSSKMFPPALLGLLYVPIAGLYVYPGVKLWMYGSAIGRLLESRSTPDLESALLQQKSFWKFSGISVIVMFVFYVVLFFALIAIGVATGMGKM